MNYRFRQAAIGFARTTPFTDSSGTIRPLSPAQLDHSLKAILADYPRAASAVSFNLVDSHDTNRVSFALDDNPGLQQLVALLQFTSFGAPMTYYGDETGFYVPGKNGFGDPYNRAPYPWADQGGTPSPQMIDYYSRLAAVRHSLPALRDGSLTTLFTKGSLYAFARVSPPDKPVIVVLNKSRSPSTELIPVHGFYANGSLVEDVLGGGRFDVQGGSVGAGVPGYGGVILVGTS